MNVYKYQNAKHDMYYRDPYTDAKKLFKKVNPKILVLPEEYHKEQATYKVVRDNVVMLPKILSSIKDSIYGGKIAKSLADSIGQITGAPKNKFDCHAVDCYQAASACFKTLEKAYSCDEHTQVCAELASYFEELSNLNNDLNKRVKPVSEKLKNLKKYTDGIDKVRYTCENVQYKGECWREDLEKKGLPVEDDPKFKAYKEEFERNVQNAIQKMKEYNSNKEVAKSFRDIKEIFQNVNLNQSK